MTVKNANELYKKLKEIEDRIREQSEPDGACKFDSIKVYVLLQAALNQFNETNV